ncbi:hypothetical protein HHI36_004927 [Cryptolaemus montrouzieri]|uniref:Uncharacterized protein n=1 Tax=Cryptolaemus montrouzieri TaxID=559131 RepID=A0ABD2NT35_9CUCU
MDAFRNTQNSLSHDLVFDGSQDFHNKILSEDYHQQFFIEYPFPVLSPLQNLEESRIKLSLNNIRKNHRKRQIQRELKKVKTKICRQNFQNYAILPSFLVNYIENKNRVLDYDFILDCSSGVLEKFYSQNELCLIRPNLDNNLAISRPETAEESITIEWLCQDPILSIENMEMENSNNFIVRGKTQSVWWKLTIILEQKLRKN